MRISPTLTTALAMAALIVPAAGAQAQPADMHASTAIAAAKAQQQPKQDLRSPDARDAASHPRGPGHAVNAPGATAVDSASTPGSPAPVAVVAASKPSNDGVDWTTVLIGIAGSLLAFGAIALAVNRRQTPPRLGTSV